MALPKTFDVSNLPQSSILYIYSIRDRIDMDPPYQREGDVWSLFKRQLLVDSLINGFDIPKIYFHDLGPSSSKRYAVIDGKQRLQAIWSFIEDAFSLSEDFVLVSEPDQNLSGMKYSDLAKRHPQLKIKFDATSLSIVRVETDDLEFIEEMFSRLNEAVPLSSAEKRRTFGGEGVSLINRIQSHSFFLDNIAFKDHRARYFDIASKLLFLEATGSIADTKREFLDSFVRDLKQNEDSIFGARAATGRIIVILDWMTQIFHRKDPLLKQVGVIPVMYWFLRACHLANVNISREKFVDFDEKRDSLKQNYIAQAAPSFDHSAIAQFNKLSQTPNDAYAIEFRVAVLVDNLVAENQKRLVLERALRYAMLEA